MIRLHIKIDDILYVWVRRWASHKGCKGYPSLQSFMREAQSAMTYYTISELTEEQYLKIDKAILELHNRNVEAYQVLMAVFLQGHSKREICDVMSISSTTFDNRLRTAKDFMEGAIFGGGVIKVCF